MIPRRHWDGAIPGRRSAGRRHAHAGGPNARRRRSDGGRPTIAHPDRAPIGALVYLSPLTRPWADGPAAANRPGLPVASHRFSEVTWLARDDLPAVHRGPRVALSETMRLHLPVLLVGLALGLGNGCGSVEDGKRQFHPVVHGALFDSGDPKPPGVVRSTPGDLCDAL